MTLQTQGGHKVQHQRGLVQPTSKGWLNPVRGLRVTGADSDRPTLDGNATGNSASVPALGMGDLLPSSSLPQLSGNTGG